MSDNSLEKAANDLNEMKNFILNTRVVTEIGLSYDSKISKTEEEAMSRADYEKYMKTLAVEKDRIENSLNNIVKNFCDDILSRKLK